MFATFSWVGLVVCLVALAIVAAVVYFIVKAILVGIRTYRSPKSGPKKL